MDWDKLETISSFDGEAKISNYSNFSNFFSDPNNLSITKPETTTSLLIQTLLDIICKSLGDDDKTVKISYDAICQKFNEMNFIDDSYSKKEFDTFRASLKKQIYKIIELYSKKNPDPELHADSCWSRYKTDFEEGVFIGHGGFGEVFKARHKLDGIEYAVKKCYFNTRNIKICHISEVKTLASLNHHNIVQYKSAWIEPLLNIKNTENKNHVSYSASSDANDVATNDSSKLMNNKSVVLFIQMALCKLTLYDWLRNCNISNNDLDCSETVSLKRNQIPCMDVAYKIFYQILQGLDYIHSKEIIHHDLKPRNIFLDIMQNGDIIVQIGDFGLACPLQTDHIGSPLGTELYAAPEQLAGECNPKSDVFSLGIVLLELLFTCNTDMERNKLITNAKKKIFPEEFSKTSIKLLTSLLSSEDERPTTADLLHTLTFSENIFK